MATLVVPLASGIVGATSGTAEFYSRGTTTTPSVYSDPDAQTAVTTHTLDSNGGLERYVVESVDVIVKNSAGTEVRNFTWEVGAESIEVTNASFTGTDPVTLATVAGGRTTLDAILTLVETSLGTTNFQLLKAGAATAVLLKDAFSTVNALVYNVKDAPYNAVGNGTTNDTAGIQAAIDAAAAAGGGIVYFPYGTYRLETSALSITNRNVSLMGIGSRAAVIKQFTNTVEVLTIADTSAPEAGAQVISGLGFEHDANATNGISNAANGNGIVFRGCRVGASFTNAINDASTGSGIILENCIIEIRSAASAKGVTGLTRVSVRDTYFLYPTKSADSLFAIHAGVGSAVATGCTFDGTNLSGTAIGYGLYASAGHTGLFAHGNRLIGARTWLLGTVGAGPVVESGTQGHTTSPAQLYNATSTGVMSWGTNYAGVCLSRDTGTIVTTLNGTSYTPDAGLYGIHLLTQDSGASLAIANPTAYNIPTGARLVIVYANSSGGALTPTFGTSYKYTAIDSVADNAGCIYEFLYNGTSFIMTGTSPLDLTLP